MLESYDLLDVQSVLAGTAVRRDLVDQHSHFRRRIHPIPQPQFERRQNLREAICPVRLHLAILNLLRSGNDFGQPLSFNGGRNAVVGEAFFFVSRTLASDFIYLFRTKSLHRYR